MGYIDFSGGCDKGETNRQTNETNERGKGGPFHNGIVG
jgi:hypothetical protein